MGETLQAKQPKPNRQIAEPKSRSQSPASNEPRKFDHLTENSAARPPLKPDNSVRLDIGNYPGLSPHGIPPQTSRNNSSSFLFTTPRQDSLSALNNFSMANTPPTKSAGFSSYYPSNILREQSTQDKRMRGESICLPPPVVPGKNDEGFPESNSSGQNQSRSTSIFSSLIQMPGSSGNSFSGTSTKEKQKDASKDPLSLEYLQDYDAINRESLGNIFGWSQDGKSSNPVSKRNTKTFDNQNAFWEQFNNGATGSIAGINSDNMNAILSSMQGNPSIDLQSMNNEQRRDSILRYINDQGKSARPSTKTSLREDIFDQQKPAAHQDGRRTSNTSHLSPTSSMSSKASRLKDEPQSPKASPVQEIGFAPPQTSKKPVPQNTKETYNPKEMYPKEMYSKEMYPNPKEIYPNPKEIYPNPKEIYPNPKEIYPNPKEVYRNAQTNGSPLQMQQMQQMQQIPQPNVPRQQRQSQQLYYQTQEQLSQMMNKGNYSPNYQVPQQQFRPYNTSQPQNFRDFRDLQRENFQRDQNFQKGANLFQKDGYKEGFQKVPEEPFYPPAYEDRPLVPAQQYARAEDGRPLLGATKVDQLMLVIQAREKGNKGAIRQAPDGSIIASPNPDHNKSAVLPSSVDLVGGVEKHKEVDEHDDKRRKRRAKNQECPYCFKKFNQSTHLDVHVRSHIGYKPFQCNYCQKRFTQGGNLRTHLRLHTGEKPFSCDVCSRNFSRKGNLAAHMLTHKKEKPFECKLDNCDKSFTQLGNLKSHQNKFHLPTLTKLTQTFSSITGDALDRLPKEERSMLDYFAGLYKNSNKGIRGRGKG